ncbi:hypothetical protein C8J57DRAFT_1582858 [Mycena rebaudengoi]|nr:hypothetical protein C8J57DRAFT_1582858 [Mycena rebaudengoi]
MDTVPLDDTTIAYDQRITRYLYLAGIVVLLYDNLLTLDLEVQYIWKSWRTRGAAWYLVIRYSSLWFPSMALLVFGNFTPELLMVVLELFVGCTLILRVLAMYSFDRRVLLTLVTAAIVCVSLAVWCVIPNGPSIVLRSSPYRCISLASHSGYVREAGAWEVLLAGDILLLGFTLYRAYTHSREIPTGSLWHVLVRDGAIIICIANLANILMFYFGDAITAKPNSTHPTLQKSPNTLAFSSGSSSHYNEVLTGTSRSRTSRGPDDSYYIIVRSRPAHLRPTPPAHLRRITLSTCALRCAAELPGRRFHIIYRRADNSSSAPSTHRHASLRPTPPRRCTEPMRPCAQRPVPPSPMCLPPITPPAPPPASPARLAPAPAP